MDNIWNEVLWRQFGAAIDMVGNALDACPPTLWEAPMWNDPSMPPGFSQFWYVAFHTLFWLDLYLYGRVEGFQPPVPFTLDELDSQGVLPERVYTVAELQAYLGHCRQKCRVIISQMTDEKASRLSYFTWRKNGISFAELLLDNMRHVQEHGAQLNMFLGQHVGKSASWMNLPKDDRPAN